MVIKVASIGRIVTIIFGVFFLFLSLSMIFAGTAVLVINETLTDTEGYMKIPNYQISDSEAVAITFEIQKISENSFKGPEKAQWLSFDLGDFVKFKINSPNKFIGIGYKSNVTQYLSNSTYLQITSINFDSIETIRINDEKTGDLLTNPPQSVNIWLHTSVSELRWEPTPKELTKDLIIVIMNTDGSKGFNETSISAGVLVPIIEPIGIALLVFGFIFLILSIVLFVIAAKRKKTISISTYRIYKGSYATYDQSKPQQSLRCSNCGTEIDEDSRFCHICGEPIIRAKSGSDKPQQPINELDIDTTAVSSPNAFVIADWGIRFWAWLIDVIIINFFVESVRWSVIFSTSKFPFESPFFCISIGANGIAMFLYFGLLEGKYGTTIGKHLLGLIVVKESGEPITYQEAFISAIGKSFLLPIDIIIGLVVKTSPEKKKKICTPYQRAFQRIAGIVTVHRPPPGITPTEGFLSPEVLKY